jgi:hypothetical protein
MNRLLLTTCVAVLSSPPAAVHGEREQTDADRREALRWVRQTVLANHFELGRGLVTPVAAMHHVYGDALGNVFSEDIQNWGPELTILDAGAGRANFAHQLRAKLGDRTPRFIALSVSPPADLVEVPENGSIIYRSGELGRHDGQVEASLGAASCDVIIDVFGAAHYVAHLDWLMASYGWLLRSGGRLYMHFEFPRTTFSKRGQDRQVHRDNLTRWLGAIRGLRVLYQEGTDTMQVVLERSSAPRVVVPALELVRFRHDAPPSRRYEHRAHADWLTRSSHGARLLRIKWRRLSTGRVHGHVRGRIR